MVSQDGAPLRTFVVERQSLIAKALHSFLNQNALVRVVGDAPSVRVDDMERTRPDLIVYGLDNAAQDVTEALNLARSVLPNVRFCVLSSYANPDVMQRSIASGADGFVVKDVSPSELDVALRVLASGASYVDPRVAGGMLKRRFTTGAPGSAISELTSREADILRLIATGFSNKEISAKLKLSEKTIKNYVSRIFSKLNVTARTQAAVYAIKAGFA
ncbi:MAG: response regulator transcription factor [Candidatus Velthaea sp.]|jgi:DNA-binding NarL/FixJ family response regulator